MSRVLGEFDVAVGDAGRTAHSQSPATVHRVCTAMGQDAYLKTTPAELGTEAIAAARRELRFYREVAPHLACRTPDLIDSHDAEDGVAMLLTSAGRTVKPQSWSPNMWAATGTQLALLHRTPLPSGGDWCRPDPLLQAIADPDTDRIRACWAPVLPELPRILASSRDLLSYECGRQSVFTHGDCHTGNIAFLADRPGFCDWQGAVIGRPVSDLAFLSVRVTPSGAVVPPDLVAAYLRQAAGDQADFERALVAEELAIFVFLWPHFSHLSTSTERTLVRRRACFLASR